MIPPMTHELSRAWNQPDTSQILIDDTHAAMSEKTFFQLKEYSTSQPSGVYEGKMWRRHQRYENAPPEWLLCWFGFSDKPNCCSNNYRIILLIC